MYNTSLVLTILASLVYINLLQICCWLVFKCCWSSEFAANENRVETLYLLRLNCNIVAFEFFFQSKPKKFLFLPNIFLMLPNYGVLLLEKEDIFGPFS